MSTKPGGDKSSEVDLSEVFIAILILLFVDSMKFKGLLDEYSYMQVNALSFKTYLTLTAKCTVLVVNPTLQSRK